MPIYLSSQTPWFAFLVHFRNIDDLYRVGGASFLRQFSNSEAEFQMKMCSLPAQVGGEFLFGFTAIRGELVGIMRMPEEMMAPNATEIVLEGIELAVRRGARVIGLGALTSPATGGGLKLIRHLPKGVTLTNGNAYTAAIVRCNVMEASCALGMDKRARVAIVGCTGSVGVPATYLLAEVGFDLILVGRSIERVQRQFGALASQALFAGNLSAVRDADIVVLLTSDPTALLTPGYVRSGAIVIDCAQPANITPSAHGEFQRDNVSVVEGGVVQIPEYTCTCDLGLTSPKDTFACLAETYLFAREGIHEHSIGRPSVEMARRLEQVGQRYNVTPRPLNLN